MLSRLHSKLGTAGFIISIVALVAALGGGAYAASGGLSGKQKKEVEKIAKKYAGKPGATGATGPAGAAGPAGATGAKGDTGSPGGNGTNGTDGTNGKSVIVVSEEPEGCANEEGVIYEVEGSGTENEVCSGALPGTLGPEETETGTFTTQSSGEAWVPINFTIPLAGELDASHVVRVPGSGQAAAANCDDGVAPPPSASHPEAKPGYLCVFRGFVEGGEAQLESIFKPTEASPEEGDKGASTAGAVARVFAEGGTPRVSGTWAVTGAL